MKNPIESNFFHILAYSLLSIFFIFFFSACKTDDPDVDMKKSLVGTWSQVSRSIDGVEILKDSTRLLIQIQTTQICVLCDSTAAAKNAKKVVTRSGWSYSVGLFNLAVDLPASWKPTVNADNLQLERADFKLDGTISKTVVKFKRIPDIQIK